MRKKRLFVAAAALCGAVAAASAYATGGPMMMGPTHSIQQTSFK